MLTALRSAAIEDGDGRVRTAAVAALEHHGLPEIKRLVRDFTEQPVEAIDPRTYVALTKSERPELRMIGLVAIGLDGTPALGDAVLAAFDDPDHRVRERAVTAAMHLGLGRAGPALVDALNDAKPAVQEAAATAIGELNLSKAVPALASATKDENESVRLAALDALAGLGSPAAIEPLSEALGSASESVNRLAVYGLLELLSNATGDGGSALRERVQHVAEDAPRSTVIDTILGLLEEMDGTVQRRNAVWLLGQLIGSRPAEETLITLVALVGDEDDQTSKLATMTLVSCEGMAVEQLVRHRLADIDPDSREASQLAYVLGRVGTSRSKPVLEEVVNATEQDAVRKQAVSSLKRLDVNGG